MFEDLRAAARRLLRVPGFSLVVAGLLAVALAVAGSAFALYYGLALKPLPYPQQDRLLTLDVELLGNRYGLSPALLTEIDRRVDGIQAIGGYQFGQRAWRTGARTTTIQVAEMEPSLLPLLGAMPVLGRLPTTADVEPGAVSGMVISQSFWRQRFAADPAVIGQRLHIGEDEREVLGVLPDSFAFPARDIQAWLPLGFDAAQRSIDNAGLFSGVQAVARLAPGATRASLAPALTTVLADAFKPHVIETAQMRLDARPLRELWSAGQARPALLMLLVGGLVWLVTCVNLCNLAISRALSRQHDVAVHSALGADRARLIRQAVAEAAWLGSVASIVGLLLVPVLLAGLAWLDWLPTQTALRFGVDAMTVLVVLGLAAAASVCIAAAMGGFRSRMLAVALRAGGGQRQSAGRGVQRLRHALVVVQVAVSLALLAGIGLLLRSSQALLAEDVGFDRNGLVTASLSHLIDAGADAGKDADAGLLRDRLRHAADRVAALPGVTAVGLGNPVPFGGGVSISHYRFGDEVVDGQGPAAYRYRIDDGYFPAMGMPVLRGRAFTADEVRREAALAIVDTAFVRRHLGDRDPIGQRVRVDSGDQAGNELTIVGVVAEVRPRQLHEPSEHVAIYQPAVPTSSATLLVRAAAGGEGLVEPIRAALVAASPAVEIGPVATMSETIVATLADRARLNRLLEGLGALSMLLSACGLYAVLAFLVQQRQREFGVRLALGAPPRGIGLRVITQALNLLGFGCLAGLPLVWLASRLLRQQLYGITPFDPVSVTVAMMVLLLAAMAAALLPAWRASRVDPQQALRGD